VFAKFQGGVHFWVWVGMTVRCGKLLEKVGILKRDGFVVVEGRNLCKTFIGTMVINQRIQ
jgi:hypothetical protein